MLSMTRAEVESLYKRAQSAQSRIKRVKEQADEVVDTIVATVETTGAAFALGMVNGRYNGVEVVGVPLDLLLGGGAHVLGFLGVGGEHLHNMGNGAFCSYSTTLGAGIGREMAQKAAAAAAAQLPGGAAARGFGAGRLTDQQLRDLANGAPAG